MMAHSPLYAYDGPTLYVFKTRGHEKFALKSSTLIKHFEEVFINLEGEYG